MHFGVDVTTPGSAASAKKFFGPVFRRRKQPTETNRSACEMPIPERRFLPTTRTLNEERISAMSDWVSLKESLGLSLRPIDNWPGKPRYDREMSPYSAPFKQTLATLKKELSALSAKNIVLQVALRDQDLRLDGLPRAGAIATHPGIILAFDSKHGPLRLYFDRFTKWDQNLRAVALHLEHLRLAGLYGVGTDGQQYRGWQALPANADVDSALKSKMQAAEWLLMHSGVSGNYDRPEVRAEAYRKAQARLHPDAGGSHEEFLRVAEAKKILES